MFSNLVGTSGKALPDIPTDYLQWVVLNVTNKPSVVKKVKKYLSGLAQPQEKPKLEGLKRRVVDIASLHRPPSPTSAIEEGDLHFEPYVFPAFFHPLMKQVYNGKTLMEIPIWELDLIPGIKEFTVARVCYLYRFIVRRTYEEALSIDLSKLDAGGVYQYKELLDLCRRIQSALDSIADPMSAMVALRSSGFECVFNMRLPGSA